MELIWFSQPNTQPLEYWKIIQCIIGGSCLMVSVAFNHQIALFGIYSPTIELFTVFRSFKTHIPTAIATFPYAESFENGTGGWTALGLKSSWAFGNFTLEEL